jgi:hypothetical protein
MMNRKITSARIDVPLHTEHTYLFVAPEDCERSQWWRQLYQYLQGLPKHALEWRFEPSQAAFVSSASLTEADREDLVRFLRNAPPEEVAAHKTLRRAVGLPVDAVSRLHVVFFSRSE